MKKKSEFILNLYKMIHDFKQKKYNNQLLVYKKDDDEKIFLKKLFQQKINELMEKYYIKIIVYLEERSINGKNSGILIIQKDNFRLNVTNNPPSRNLELVMRQMFKTYDNILNGLEYQIWNQNNNLYLKLIW
jgi:hypothetical protein